MVDIKLALVLLCVGLAAAEPLLLVSKQPHSPLLDAEQLKQYLSESNKVTLIEIEQHLEHDLVTLQKTLAEHGVTPDRVSSLFANSETIQLLKEKLLDNSETTEQTEGLYQAKQALSGQEGDLLFHLKVGEKAPRVLQETAVNTRVESKIFNNLTTHALSGLWVTLFLLVVLGIGLSCSFDLKTNDRFARQNLWRGHDS